MVIWVNITLNSAVHTEDNSWLVNGCKVDNVLVTSTYRHTFYSSGVVRITNPLEFSLALDLTAASPVFTLTCISTGGPATTVTWTRDGAAATGVTSQTVVDQEAITYNNTLTVTGRLPGNYTCSVANNETAQPATASLTVAGE